MDINKTELGRRVYKTVVGTEHVPKILGFEKRRQGCKEEVWTGFILLFPLCKTADKWVITCKKTDFS